VVQGALCAAAAVLLLQHLDTASQPGLASATVVSRCEDRSPGSQPAGQGQLAVERCSGGQAACGEEGQL
jgi:hypothetical protein